MKPAVFLVPPLAQVEGSNDSHIYMEIQPTLIFTIQNVAPLKFFFSTRPLNYKVTSKRCSVGICRREGSPAMELDFGIRSLALSQRTFCSALDSGIRSLALS